MSSSQPDAPEPVFPPVKLDPLGAVLSFLIPGLGQVYQGRVGKGLLFFFGLYLLFFDGMWMGSWRNVWIPDAHDLPDVQLFGNQLEGLPKALYYRPQYLGQFWIGVAAWPAIYQYIEYAPAKEAAPVFGKFERMPKEDPELNDLQRNSSKRWDLGWVYTVIAGVLNLLVIYDALAGPMFREPLTSTVVETPSPPSAAPAKAAIPPPVSPAPPEAPPAAPPAPAAQPQPVAQPKGGQA